MNYLELCQRYRRETGYGSDGPTTVVSQSGAHLQNVEWIADAYVQLQNRTDWRWLRRPFTLTTSASDSSYAYTDCTDVDASAAISRFKSWRVGDRWNPPKIYLQSAGQGAETLLTYIPWDQFSLIYRVGTREEGYPAHISVDPSDNLVLGPTPDSTYVISGEFNRSAQVLDATDDTDTPEMPSDFHMLIVYLAMEDGGYFEVADEVLARSKVKGRRLLRQLEALHAPRMRMAGPLV